MHIQTLWIWVKILGKFVFFKFGLEGVSAFSKRAAISIPILLEHLYFVFVLHLWWSFEKTCFFNFLDRSVCEDLPYFPDSLRQCHLNVYGWT